MASNEYLDADGVRTLWNATKDRIREHTKIENGVLVIGGVETQISETEGISSQKIDETCTE